MAASTKIGRLTQHPESLGYLAIAYLNRLIRLWLNMCTTDAGTATATVTSQVKTVATAVYTIDGEFKSKAATDPLWTLTGATVAVSSWQKWLLLLDASGTASVLIGTPSTVSAAAVVLPEPPDSKSIIGVLTVATNGSTTFVPGTTLLGAAGITATYVDGNDPSIIPTLKDGPSNTIILS